MQIWHALILLMINVVIGLPIADVVLIDGSQLNGELTSMNDEEDHRKWSGTNYSRRATSDNHFK